MGTGLRRDRDWAPLLTRPDADRCPTAREAGGTGQLAVDSQSRAIERHALGEADVVRSPAASSALAWPTSEVARFPADVDERGGGHLPHRTITLQGVN
jgi:hypothetical protein